MVPTMVSLGLPGEGLVQAEPLGFQVQDPPWEVCPTPNPVLPPPWTPQVPAWLTSLQKGALLFHCWLLSRRPLSPRTQSRREGPCLAQMVHKVGGMWGS